MQTKAKRSRKAASDKRYRTAHPATDETRVQVKERIRKHRRNQTKAKKRYYTVQGVRRRAAVGISGRTRERNRLRAAAHRLLSAVTRWGGALRVDGRIVATDPPLPLYLSGGVALESYLNRFIEVITSLHL